MHKHYLESLKERRQNWTRSDKIKFSQLSNAQKEVARQHFANEAQSVVTTNTSTSVVSSLTTDTSGRASQKGIVSNLPTVLVCSYNNGKPLLPVQIDGQLPHITIALGDMDTCPSRVVSSFALFLTLALQ
jgi:hypothetical protein